MATEYINYIQTEELIKLWPTIQGIKESLKSEYKKVLQNTPEQELNDLIYSQSIGNKALTGLPPSGNISDTTGNTALSYHQNIRNEENETINLILGEQHHICLVDDKLSIAFRRLTDIQRKIINCFYIEGKTWAETLDELKKEDYFISKQTAQRTRRDGIYKVQRIAKITRDTYLEVMKLVEVE